MCESQHECNVCNLIVINKVMSQHDSIGRVVCIYNDLNMVILCITFNATKYAYTYTRYIIATKYMAVLRWQLGIA